MSIELSFGGTSAWAYKKLSDNLTHKLNIVFGVGYSKSLDIQKIPTSRYNDTYLIIDEEIIEMSSVDLLIKKVRGLGRNKAVSLLQIFGSVDDIKNANILELQKIDGIGRKLSDRIKKSL